MADQAKDKASVGGAGPQQGFTAETQRQRWVKYGANVALSCVVVLLLTAAAVYIAGRLNVRKDTTEAGAYSLKPASVRLIENLPQKVEVVGLFSKAQQEQDKRVRTDDPAVRYQQVADLLQEYQQKSGGKISARMIDPVNEPSKLDELFNRVAKKYGNDYAKYEEVLKTYPTTLDEINRLAKEELEAVRKAAPTITDRAMARTMGSVVLTVQVFPEILDTLREDVKKQLELKVPDYKGAADAIERSLRSLTDQVEGVEERYKAAQGDAKTPEAFKQYIGTALPRYEAIRKAAGDLLKKVEGLGELKQLDELRRNKSDSIAVLGETDIKVLPLASIYQADNARGGRLKPRFAGEQQVSTALVALTAKEKKKVAFVRSGGPPLTEPTPRSRPPMGEVAGRLRAYGMEVLEKDVSGTWAMQAMQMSQGMPPPPEPTDEQLKDAVWVVLMSQQDPRQMMMNPAGSQLGSKVGEHVRNGGSAMVIVAPRAEKPEFLKEFGIDVRPELLVVHDAVEAKGAATDDIAQQGLREPYVFVMSEYGDHPLTRPLRSLDGLFLPIVPMSTVEAKGVRSTRLLPIPETPRPWADPTALDEIQEGKTPTFTPNAAERPDVPGPLWAGAAAERDGGKGRVVVFGCLMFAFDEHVGIRDYAASQAQDRHVARFPANGELFVNGVFWLANMDTMIAISPTALEVPRVAAMTDVARDVTRVGLLIVGLPLMVLAAGTFVYLKRRD
jgi:hypothetical protein